MEEWGAEWEGWSLDRQLSALLLEQQIYARHDFAQAHSTAKIKPFSGLDIPGKKPRHEHNPFNRMLAEAKAYEARTARN